MSGRRTILVVDDIELNRAILCEMFQAQYAILEASNGQEALDLIEQYEEQITIILLDVVMPVMDGIEVLHRLRSTGRIKKIPVILITAENNESTALEGYTIGVSDIVNKPFNPEIVIRRVENIVELHDHRRNLEERLEEQYETLRRQEEKIKQANNFVIDTLSTVVEFRDNESGSHVRNIRRITKNLLTSLSNQYEEYFYSQERISMIADAAALHDIGKIVIPDAVLLKSGKLTPEEFEIMKTHTVRGCEILEKLGYDKTEDYYRYCYEICRHHHERWDGKGYPDGLAGEDIPLCAQVVSLADVYEALTSKRVYKDAYSEEKAVSMILNGECGCFNPRLLDCFMSVIDSLSEETGEGAEAYSDVIPPQVHLSDELSERTLRLLELERQKYRTLSDLTGDITFDYDMSRNVLTFSERYIENISDNFKIEDASEQIHRTDLLMQEDKNLLWDTVSGLSPTRDTCRLELQVRTRSGEFEWFEVYMSSIWDTEGNQNCISMIGKLTNIHTSKMEAVKLKKKANTDPLTGVFNRAAVEELVSDCLQKEQTSALFFLDLDYFKEINDSQGHTYGDEVLRLVGKGLKNLFRDGDVVGRIGGDEFVVFLKDIALRKDLEAKASQVCSLFYKIGREMQYRHALSGSVGIACCPQDGTTFAVLLDHADKALYQAKNSGKNQYVFYSDEDSSVLGKA